MDDLVDVYATREMLEVEALQRAWSTIDEEAVARLRELREAMVAANRASQARRAYDLHRQVHFAIYELSGSPWLLHLIDILWNHTERYRRMVARVATFLEVGEDLHGHVIEAIAAGDPDRAGQALGRDLRRTRDLIIAASPAQLMSAAASPAVGTAGSR
jgi:DNA-binding GntR family transcriptional regulator